MKGKLSGLSIALLGLLSLQGTVNALSTLDVSSFFETGLLRSEDRVLFQNRPRDIPVSSQSSGWQFVVFRPQGFSIWMPPGVITNENVTLDTSLGKVKFQATASNSDTGRSVVAFSDTLTAAQLQNPRTLLDAIKERVAPSGQYRLVRESNITLNKFPGRELTLENANTTITIRAYLINNKGYVVGVSNPRATDLPRSSRAFLNSFQLLQ